MRSLKFVPLLLGLILLCLALPENVEAKRSRGGDESSEMRGSTKTKRKKKKKKNKKRKRKKNKKRKKKKKNRSAQNNGARRYPMKINARPLVLPKGMAQLSGVFKLTSVSVGKKTNIRSGLGVGFDYGVADGLQLGAGTGLLLSPDVDWGSQLNLRAGYKVAGKRKGLSLAAQAEIPLSFGEKQDVLSSINLGLATRYRVNRQFALHTGDELISLNFSNDLTTRINLPIGVAYQFDKRINVRFDSRLISTGSGNTTSIADNIPIQLRGFYTIERMMDAGVAFETDLIQDTGFKILALFNYRMR